MIHPTTFTGRNINHLYTQGLLWLKANKHTFTRLDRRGGNEVVECPVPVISCYEKPWERMLFCEIRDANPFFHIMEGLWMLAGRSDVAWISQFNSRMASFSDDGKTFHGAYGDRINEQLIRLIDLLNDKPETRRAVVQIFYPARDLGASFKDIPCNTTLYFLTRQDKLDMTICCRSNDFFWGMYGSNPVHFSMIHEVVCAKVGKRQGRMWQFSNNVHYYLDQDTAARCLSSDKMPSPVSAYETHLPEISITMPMVTDPDNWFGDLTYFMGWETPGNEFEAEYKNPWFIMVAVPVIQAWWKYKEGDLQGALWHANSIGARDVRNACVWWLERRLARRK